MIHWTTALSAVMGLLALVFWIKTIRSKDPINGLVDLILALLTSLAFLMSLIALNY